jgi:hypothetical protein
MNQEVNREVRLPVQKMNQKSDFPVQKTAQQLSGLILSAAALF